MTRRLRSRILRRALFCVALLAVVIGPADAQGSCSASVGSPCHITVPAPNATALTNPRVIHLLSQSPHLFSWTVTQANLDAGVSDDVAVTLVVNSNRAWTLSANGATTWTVSGGGNTAKASSDLRWALSSTVTGTAITSTPVIVQSGSAGTTTLAISFKTVLGWTSDRPGTYSMPVTFLLASP